ncbi:MAG: RidA family protein [Planctomycetaceae bacterium]
MTEHHSEIRRLGTALRWADVVIHAGVARWVEVPGDVSDDFSGQVRQVFQQIDGTLQELGTGRDALLQVLIYVADLSHVDQLNTIWDAWVIPGSAPVRACVQAGLGKQCLIEMIITAAVPK